MAIDGKKFAIYFLKWIGYHLLYMILMTIILIMGIVFIAPTIFISFIIALLIIFGSGLYILITGYKYNYKIYKEHKKDLNIFLKFLMIIWVWFGWVLKNSIV